MFLEYVQIYIDYLCRIEYDEILLKELIGLIIIHLQIEMEDIT